MTDTRFFALSWGITSIGVVFEICIIFDLAQIFIVLFLIFLDNSNGIVNHWGF